MRRGFGYAAALGVVWLVAAGLRPATTYHLAPILVAATPPLVLLAGEFGLDARAVITTATAGVALALGLTIFLTVTDWLRGPSLLPFGSAVTESIVFAFVGGTTGFAIAFLRRPNR